MKQLWLISGAPSGNAGSALLHTMNAFMICSLCNSSLAMNDCQVYAIKGSVAAAAFIVSAKQIKGIMPL
jgi:hypothetical protein